MSRLEEIKEQMEDLLEEAMDEVRSEGNEVTREGAYGYWYAHIKTALTNEHMFLGGSMCTMEDTVKELENEECQNCGEEALERDDNDNPICYDCNVA